MPKDAPRSKNISPRVTELLQDDKIDGLRYTVNMQSIWKVIDNDRLVP
jgi:hypothetical protein